MIKMLDKRIVKNACSLLGLKASTYIIPLLTLPYLTMTLQPEGYGRLAFGLAVIQYIVIAVNYGFDLSVTKQIAQNPNCIDYVSRIFWSVLVTKVFISIFGLFIIIALSFFVDDINDILGVVLCGYGMVVGAALFPQWLFQGKEQLGKISIYRIFSQAVSIPFIFLFIKSASDVDIAIFLSSVPSLVMLIFSSVIIKKRNWVKLITPSFNDILLQVREGFNLFISTSSISIYTTSVIVILGFFWGPVQVGIYAAANKLLQALLGICGAISTAFYPRISALVINNKAKSIKNIQVVLFVLLFVSALLGFVIWSQANFIVSILFGDEYLESVDVLMVLCFVPFVVSFSNVFGIQALLTHGYSKEFSRVIVFCGFFSLLIIIPLVKYYSSIGAAISVLLTEILVSSLMFAMVIHKKIEIFSLNKSVSDKVSG